MREQRHEINCYVPAAVAALLDQEPQLVSAAIDAFHIRDVLDERACKRMETFAPSRSVYCRVSMSRCLYAQLAAQTRFQLPHVFGELPPAKSDRYTPHLMGARLVCSSAVILPSSINGCLPSAYIASGVWNGNLMCSGAQPESQHI